jgi:hypothetical protein
MIQKMKESVNQLIYDYVIVGSRKFRKRANKIGQKIKENGFQVKLISKPAPRIEVDGVDVLKKFKTKYQRQHFEAIRCCKRGIIICNFNDYIGLNTKAEMIFAHAYGIPIFSVENVISDEEELEIMNIKRLNLDDL